MANTWHGRSTGSLPEGFDSRKADGGVGSSYELRRAGNHFEYVTALPDGKRVASPVEAIVGGQRHGLSFLLRIGSAGGIALDRPALAEGRYAYSLARRELVVSPGFALEKPTTYEDALGNVLSATFEQKCLKCHGQPNTLGAGKEGGVHCESCHGSALAHVSAVGHGKPHDGVVNPARLNAAEKMAVCAQCHTGFTNQSDPLPDDLLVSNQVNSLSRAECFVQTGGKIGCTSCHDPHSDATNVQAASVRACLGCHATNVSNHAGICPVNATNGCVGCHMPSVQKGAFGMADHWIRVHAGQAPENRRAESKSQVTPLREFLRILVTQDGEKARAAEQRIANGESFSQVASGVSTDPTAGAGGYLGEIELSQLDARLAQAAAALWYEESSPVIDLGNRYVILHRLERDFKWRAGELFQQAADLKQHGDIRGAAAKDREALAVYPYLLRGMILMATTLAESGNTSQATEILRFAVQSYPTDAPAQFNLALTLAAQPAEQISAFQKALELDPDMVAVYESLGAAQYAAGRAEEALETFRKGLLIDPLSAKLNYNLGIALAKQGNRAESERRMALAALADPQIVSINK